MILLSCYIQATWGKRCDKLLFVSEGGGDGGGANGTMPMLEVRVESGREHLTAKTMKAFDHIYEDHLHVRSRLIGPCKVSSDWTCGSTEWFRTFFSARTTNAISLTI